MGDNGRTGRDAPEMHRPRRHAADGTEQKGTAAQTEVRRILQARAVELARIPDMKEQGENIRILEFVLAPHRYAVETTYIREVLPLREITPIPSTPDFIQGVMNVRGKLLSITNLSRFFSLPVEGGDGTAVIVLASETMETGIIADRILGVATLPITALQAGISIASIEPDFLRGVTRARTAVLDAAAILADPRLVINEEAAR